LYNLNGHRNGCLAGGTLGDLVRAIVLNMQLPCPDPERH
jgi:hypothetical protein